MRLHTCVCGAEEKQERGGMLRIGYVRLKDQDSAVAMTTLKALGCHAVRAEKAAGPGEESAVLASILDFVGAGDHLVVARLGHLSSSPRALLDILSRMEQRSAVLEIIDQGLSTTGEGGRALKAALEAAASLEAAPAPLRRRPEADEILQLQRAGVGPVEIARRLGVSRMTVWRKLKAVESALHA
jgi:DNA invertase Pin-like site-specific DNA recombinase